MVGRAVIAIPKPIPCINLTAIRNATLFAKKYKTVDKRENTRPNNKTFFACAKASILPVKSLATEDEIVLMLIIRPAMLAATSKFAVAYSPKVDVNSKDIAISKNDINVIEIYTWVQSFSFII